MEETRIPSVSRLKEISESFRDAAERLPAYQEMLPFFEVLYEIQESDTSSPLPHGIEDQLSAVSKQNGTVKPLIGRKNFANDPESSEKLMRIICETASSQGSNVAPAASKLSTSIQNNDPFIKPAFAWYLGEDDASLQLLSQKLGLDKNVLIFFLYHSIWPSLARQVQYLKAHDRINPKWAHPFCPICGSSPNLAYFSETGKRHLVCGFCRYEWPVQRILCPYCENDDPESITYIFSEEEKAYRIYTCAQCRRYIKTVDTRQLSRSFYAPLESLVTLHLDLQAESRGFKGNEVLHLFGG